VVAQSGIRAFPLRPVGLPSPSAAGAPRQPSSRSRHCSGSASRSSPTLRKGCTTATAGHWPTWTKPMAGTIRPRRLAPERRIRTSTTTIQPSGPTRSRQPNRRLRPLAAAYGGHRVSAKRPQFRTDDAVTRQDLLRQVDNLRVSSVLLHRLNTVLRGGFGLVSLTDSDDLAVAGLQPEPELAALILCTARTCPPSLCSPSPWFQSRRQR
jgi:hypothetical protein